MKNYVAEIVDSEDGSDEVILQLPPDFCKEDGWLEGDTIEWSVESNGNIVMKNLSKVQRESISNQAALPLDQPVQDT